ncbi:MAG: hypothetical protein JNN15_15335 [Blastocatellia bacterium]|nr:hypothetical protein [Blastocatellia bacterium]
MSKSREQDEKTEKEEVKVANLSPATVQSAYKIISTLLDQIESSSNLIALMASLLGEETTRRVTQTAAWIEYMNSRRSLESVKKDIESFAATATLVIEQATVEENEPDKSLHQS